MALALRLRFIVSVLPGKVIFQGTHGAKVGGVVYEACLVNRGLGQYKGWQSEPEEWPDGIDAFDWNI